MHGDSHVGEDHTHEHEQLLKKVPNQEHGPETPDGPETPEDEGLKVPHGKHHINQEHGPKDPMKDLHGILMHGDTEHGIEHDEHVHEHEHPKGEIKVFIHESVDDGVVDREKPVIPKGVIGTIDGEELIHGEHGVHKHSEKHHEEEVIKNIGPFGLDEDILHQIMHDGKIDSHTDEELKKTKKIGYEDLKDLDLGDELLGQIDLKKLLQNNKQEYKAFKEHTHKIKDTGKGEEHKHWSLWDQVSRIRLGFGAGSQDDTKDDKDPYKAEWEEVVVRRSDGEDEVAFKMQLAANSGPINSRKKNVVHDEQ